MPTNQSMMTWLYYRRFQRVNMMAQILIREANMFRELLPQQIS